MGLLREAAAEHPLTNTPRAELVGLLREAAAEHPLANTPRAMVITSPLGRKRDC